MFDLKYFQLFGLTKKILRIRRTFPSPPFQTVFRGMNFLDLWLAFLPKVASDQLCGEHEIYWKYKLTMAVKDIGFCPCKDE